MEPVALFGMVAAQLNTTHLFSVLAEECWVFDCLAQLQWAVLACFCCLIALEAESRVPVANDVPLSWLGGRRGVLLNKPSGAISRST